MRMHATDTGNSNNPALSIEPATTDDLPRILTLLKECELPEDGVAEHLTTVVVARKNGLVVGTAALELYGKDALLRSLAVKRALRNQGIGKHLTKSAFDLAIKHKVTTLYLLTQTASEFFSRFGFKPVIRAEVPPAVQSSIEFTSACPVTALAMMMRLKYP